MEDTSPEALNPYAVTGSHDSDLLSDRDRPPHVIHFRGTVVEADLRKYFHDPIQFGCLMALLVLVTITWMGVFGVIFGMVAVGALSVLGLAVGFWLGHRYLSRARAAKCIAKRPWLIGKVHGSISGSRLTVWHNDVCVQTTDRTYFDEAFKGVVIYPRGPSPLAFVPSTCFYEHEWQEIYEDYRRDRTIPLVLEAPPEGAWVCRIAMNRLPYLDDRILAVRWRLSQNSFWIAIVIGLLVFLFIRPHERFGPWITIALPIVVWSILEVGRFTWSRMSLRRQFLASDKSGYQIDLDQVTEPSHLDPLSRPSSPSSVMQWFTNETILSSDLMFWIRCPTRTIEQVRIDDLAIEFYVGGLCMTFHREGFDGPDAWLSACQAARSIAPNARQNETS
ncbi:MAG: hypothetical protein WCI02_07335 [Planctomycetota bacterium]